MIFHRHTKSTGFTLVEMMVVIALAGILAAIAYASYGDSRAQARDRIRMVQLDQLQVAIELYKDEYGRYPARGCRTTSWPASGWPQWAGPTGAVGAWNEECSDYIVGHSPGINFTPNFIDELPIDPLPRTSDSNFNIYYRTNDAGTEYQILHHQTVERLVTDQEKTSPFSRYNRLIPACNATQTNSYSVHSAGAGCW